MRFENSLPYLDIFIQDRRLVNQMKEGPAKPGCFLLIRRLTSQQDLAAQSQQLEGPQRLIKHWLDVDGSIHVLDPQNEKVKKNNDLNMWLNKKSNIFLLKRLMFPFYGG